MSAVHGKLELTHQVVFSVDGDDQCMLSALQVAFSSSFNPQLQGHVPELLNSNNKDNNHTYI